MLVTHGNAMNNTPYNVILVHDAQTNTYMLPGGIIIGENSEKSALECASKGLTEKTLNLFQLDLAL
jgi:hypothetical protein